MNWLGVSLIFYSICSLTAMAPMNLSFALILITGIAAYFKNKNQKLIPSQEFKNYRFWALSLLITCWGSLIITKFFPYAYAGHDPEVTLHGFVKIWYLLIPAVLVCGFELASNIQPFSLVKIIKPWWLATFVLMIVAIIQFFTGWPQPQLIPDHLHFFHATLFFGHHLSTASILIFPAFTALAVAAGYFSRLRRLVKEKLNSSNELIHPHFALVIGISGTIILFLSYARTAWIALLIGFGILIKKYVLPHITRKQWVRGLIAIVLALGIFSQIPMVKNRIIKSYGVSERTELWKANIDFFVHRPLTGIGWLKTQEMSEFYFKSIDPEHYRSRFWGHAHSNIFEMLGGAGILGLLAFLGWSLFTLSFAHRVSKELESQGNFFYSDFTYGLFIALILLHFNGLTNVTFWEGKVMHQQMLAIGFLLILNRKSQTSC